MICLVFSVGILGAQQINPQLTVKKSCALGIGYFQRNPAMANETAWDKIQKAADIVYIQRNWKESKNPGNKGFYESVAEDIAIARSKGLKIYLALEALSVGRDKLELPDGLRGDFSDSEIKKAYLSLVRKAAEDFKPDFFVLNVEVNLYKKFNPQDYAAYKDLYPEAYRAVKEVSPDTQTSVSISYEDFNGKNCFDEADKNIFRGFLADFEQNSDILAVSVYPFCYSRPAAIPDNFFTDLANFSSLPLFISETGWMSKSFPLILFISFKSSPKAQAEYVKRLYKLAENAEIAGKQISAINYISLVDPDPLTSKLIRSKYPALSWYCTLALCDMFGKEKPAYLMMKAWKDGSLN